MPFEVKDSGQRTEFASGMVRDVQGDKVDYERATDGPMLERWAAHLTKGCTKYPDVAPGVPNWTLAAGEEELARFRKSAMRHFMQWLRGDRDEDHAAAVYFNINGAEYVRDKINASEPSTNSPVRVQSPADTTIQNTRGSLNVPPVVVSGTTIVGTSGLLAQVSGGQYYNPGDGPDDLYF